MIAIIGDTGSGKSTLSNFLCDETLKVIKDMYDEYIIEGG